jgi:hypothetical protein
MTAAAVNEKSLGMGALLPRVLLGVDTDMSGA